MTWTALDGVVTAPDGAPVEGASVAVLPVTFASGQDPWSQVRLTRTDTHGRFRFQLKAGAYVLSPNHPQWEGIAGVRIQFTSDKRPNRPLVLRMRRGTHLLEGHLEAAQSRHPDGVVALVALDRTLTPSEDKAYCVETKGGQYRLMLPEGRYAVVAHAAGCGDFEGCISISGPRTFCVLPLPNPPSAASGEVRRWIRERAVPLATCEPSREDHDLDPFETMVGQAKVVALGEACHGTREFFQLKHRLLAFLVERMGFTVIAMEADPPATAVLNAYVLRGEGHLEEVLANLRFWTGTTQELRDLVRWLRTYNADPAHPRKVSINGMDIRSSSTLYAETLQFMKKVDPLAATWMAGALGRIDDRPQGSPPPEQAQIEAWLKSLNKLTTRMDSLRGRITARAGARAFLRHRRNLSLISQFVVILGSGVEGKSVREKAMADHFHWILSQEEPGSKAVIWAHNIHVSKALRQDWMGIQPMGRYLRTVLGEDYLVIGTAFLHGRFLALAEEGETHDVQTFAVPPEPKGTLDAALASTGYPLLALDLRQIPAQGKIADWFRTPQGTWTIGARFNPADSDVNTQMIIPADCYDVLVIVERTNPPSCR